MHPIKIAGLPRTRPSAALPTERRRGEGFMSQPATPRLRNQRISPRQIQIVHSLWIAKLRRARKRPRPETSRAARLRHITEIVGREVKTAKELSWQEANRVIHRLLEEIGPQRPLPAPEVPGEADGTVVGELPEWRPE